MSRSQYAFNPFIKFTDQQSRAGTLLILMYAAIQVANINTFHRMFAVRMLNFDTYG